MMSEAMIHIYNAADAAHPKQHVAQNLALECVQALGLLSQTFKCSTRAFEVVTSISRDWQEDGSRQPKRRRRRESFE
jgi:hypothetical protein